MFKLGLAFMCLVAAACSGGHASRSAPTTTSSRPPSARSGAGQSAALSARLQLPSRSIVGGKSETGYLVIENNTGAALHLTTGGRVRCTPDFAVVLANSNFPQSAAFAASCGSHPLIVREGETKLPFTLQSTFQTCSETGHPQGMLIPVCQRDAHGQSIAPPLPDGHYSATFFTTIANFAPVRPLPVQVIEPG